LPIQEVKHPMTTPGVSLNIPPTPGLQLRLFAGDADFPRMAVVANASFAADSIESIRRVDDIRRDYAAMTRCDPSRDILMAQIDDQLVGYARTWDWTEAEGTLVQGQLAFVHPAYRRRGVGSALLRWLEARQREVAREHPGASSWLHHASVTEGERDRAALLQKAGYRIVRHFMEMKRPTLDNIPAFALPPGFEVRPVLPEHLPAIYNAHMQALQDHWGFSPPQPGDFENWLKSRTLQPHLWQVAWHVESNAVAGQVKPWIDAEQNETQQRKRGYTEFISVGAPWRKRGLARALVVRALQAQKEAGMLESALGVDGESAFNAARLYEDCGFVVAKRSAVYRKAVGLG
jgi:mycothiol synthase